MKPRALLAALATLLVAAVQSATAQGPRFKGCETVGQVGRSAPVRPGPGGLPRTVHALTYYESADGLGILGPNGWICEATNGSSGITLLLAPPGSNLCRTDADPKNGPRIQVSFADGGFSGRFSIAKIAAMLFPSRTTNEYVRGVSDGFPEFQPQTKPYPSDRISRPAPDTVDFLTPAGVVGAGTELSGCLAVSASAPIHGRAVLRISKVWRSGEVFVRMPKDQEHLWQEVLGSARYGKYLTAP